MVTIATDSIHLRTRGYCDVIDITKNAQEFIHSHGFTEGQLALFVKGATAGITTIEYEPGLIQDLEFFFEKIIPEQADYKHHETWNDGNGFSHIRASLLKPGLTVPFVDSRLILGTWQQIILVDFDNNPRQREIILQCIGVK